MQNRSRLFLVYYTHLNKGIDPHHSCLVALQQDWLDEIERTKANKVTVDKQNAERAQQQHQKERQHSLCKEDSLESTNRVYLALSCLLLWLLWFC